MKLKSVEIQGFKSFPDKTKLEFHQPITAVVGPNGSGKSNIGDAIRWVLGEQSTKTLRGAKMEDVIFGGSKQRKAMGFASVVLNIDNRDRNIDIENDEVSISRKIYRTGESEYKINGAGVRLKDIYELFMDTGLGRDGYSIIGQGKIAEIISAKSGERREIFEEAAGISKYRYHKSEAQKRLAQAEENLERLNDILSEIEGRIEPLKRESEKASKFVIYANEKKTLEISLWLENIKEIKTLINEQTDKITLRKSDYDDINERIEATEKSIQNIFAEMQGCSVKMENNRGKIKDFEREISELTSQKAVLENDIQHNLKTLEELKGEIDALNLSENDVKAEIESKTKEVEIKEAEFSGLNEERRSLVHKSEEDKTENNLILNDINRKKAHRAALYVKINEAKLSAATTNTILSQSMSRLDEIKSQLDTARESSENRRANLGEIEETLEVFDEKISQSENEKKGYELKLGIKEGKAAEINEKISAIADEIKSNSQRSKLLSDMENSMEGFSHSVKAIHRAAKQGRLTGIIGPVASVIKTEEKYSLAVETALGASMQNILVKDEFAAKQAISHLAREKAGRATFLPLTSVRGSKLDVSKIENEEGFVGLGSNLASFDPKYEHIIDSLLGRIAVFRDLDLAMPVAKKNGYKFKIVTLDGQVINAGGSFTGGSHSQSAGILSRRLEIEKLAEKNRELAEKSSVHEKELSEIQRGIDGIKAHIKAIDSGITVIMSDRQMAVSEKNELEYIIKSDSGKIELFAKEQTSLEKQIAEYSENNASAKTIIENFEKDLQKTEGEIDNLTKQKEKLTETLNIYSVQINEINMKILILEKDTETIKQNIQSLNLQKQNHGEKLAFTQNKIKSITEENENLKGKISDSAERIIKLSEDSEEYARSIKILTEKRTSLEMEATTLRNSTKDITIQRERLSAEISRFEEKKNSLQGEYDVIIAKLWEEYELTRTEAEKIAINLEDREKTEKRLYELKSAIKALGSINLGSIEEYKEVNERYIFMKGQIEDVEKSRKALGKMIADLTDQMRNIFSSQFELINENFSQIFCELFDGGRGRLYLTNPSDILESGIEIEVEPPGKIIKSLTALSGGEQSFIAVAIYFAILKVNPSPFCILDEIEAALDDVNVSKYAKYLRKLSDKTQFIAITHRRGTMEEADVLYGVAMQEEGVSKLLELKVTEIEQRLGIT